MIVRCLVLVCFALGFGSARLVAAAGGAVCESPPTGSVMLLILPTDAKVQAYKAELEARGAL